MKKRLLPGVYMLLFFTLRSRQTAAQSYTSSDCYTVYKKRGEAYISKGNFDLAAQQFKQAKYCAQLNVVQRKTLDSLITVTNSRIKPLGKGVIIRRF